MRATDRRQEKFSIDVASSHVSIQERLGRKVRGF